jgi:hypothetical protein
LVSQDRRHIFATPWYVWYVSSTLFITYRKPILSGLGREDSGSEYLVTENKDIKKEQEKEEQGKDFTHFYSPAYVAKPELSSSFYPPATKSIAGASSKEPSAASKSHLFLPTPSSRPSAFQGRGKDLRRDSEEARIRQLLRRTTTSRPPGRLNARKPDRQRSDGSTDRYRANSLERDEEEDETEEDDLTEDEEEPEDDEEDSKLADNSDYDYEDEDDDVKEDKMDKQSATDAKKKAGASPEYYYYYYYDDVHSGIDIRDVA